jgi:hypothetical protein
MELWWASGCINHRNVGNRENGRLWGLTETNGSNAEQKNAEKGAFHGDEILGLRTTFVKTQNQYNSRASLALTAEAAVCTRPLLAPILCCTVLGIPQTTRRISWHVERFLDNWPD